MNNKKLIVSAYGSHDSSISYWFDGKIRVLDTERWLGSKHIAFCNYMPAKNMQLVFDEMMDWVFKETGKSEVDVYITGYMNDKYIKPKFKYKETFGIDHHTAHAACAFFQSPYSEALVCTADGGGDGHYLTINLANRETGIKRIDSYPKDLGFAYMILADYMSEIKRESLTIGNLVYAGKFMGLCGYGKVVNEWMPHFMKFYDSFEYGGDGYIGGRETTESAVTTLMKAIGIENFDIENTRFSGELSQNISACSQLAFEETFLKYIKPYLDKYPDLPICLSGGCALNIIFNTRLAKMRNGKVFIPPNPNDCGVGVGQLLAYLRPEHQVDLTYAGIPIMDQNRLASYLEDRTYSIIENIELSDVGAYLARGNTVGFIQGNAEHGPRALGNRSLLANPAHPGMKDHINYKLKNREPFRPTSPVVKKEDVQKYFDFCGTDSRHMTFVADVREEWKHKLDAIVHVDGTGRLQTVTRWQNEVLYDLITEFEQVAGHGVLLNTSLNVNGKPILSTYAEALDILKNTAMNSVYIHERKLMIFKNGDEKKFNKCMEAEGLSPVSLESTVNVWAFPKDDDQLTNEFLPKINKLAAKVERLVIITHDSYNLNLTNLFKDQQNVKIYSIGNNRHYYSSLLHKNLKNHELAKDMDHNSPYFFSQWIKPLWTKEILRDNLFNTKYHVFVDLSLDGSYNYDVVRDIKILTDLAKVENDFVSMSAVNNYNSQFKVDNLDNKFGKDAPWIPLPYFYLGSLETVEWYSNHYEAMMLHYLNQQKVGTLIDYCLASLLEYHSKKYNLIEMETI